MFSGKDYQQTVSLLTLTLFCTELNWILAPPGTVLFRSRDFDGEIFRDFDGPPPHTALVPSLGPTADTIVDGLGIPTPIITLLHTTFINARRMTTKRGSFFISSMADHGMSLMEGAMFWNIIVLPANGRAYPYRVRIDVPYN